MKDLTTLKAAQKKVLADPSLKPANGVTHCSQGAQIVASDMGCHELEDARGHFLLADAQYEIMSANKSGKWQKVPGCAASLWAQQGGLSFAAMTSKMLTERGAQAAVKAGKPIPPADEHGHIASISPEPMQMSGSLGYPVPMLCNIGRQDADEKESAAFPVSCGEADYFIYLG
jgi:hypothetical protein